MGVCREEKCVSLIATCGCVSGGKNLIASYLGVGGCRDEKCVSLLATCGCVSGGEMC